MQNNNSQSNVLYCIYDTLNYKFLMIDYINIDEYDEMKLMSTFIGCNNNFHEYRKEYKRVDLKMYILENSDDSEDEIYDKLYKYTEISDISYPYMIKSKNRKITSEDIMNINEKLNTIMYCH